MEWCAPNTLQQLTQFIPYWILATGCASQVPKNQFLRYWFILYVCEPIPNLQLYGLNVLYISILNKYIYIYMCVCVCYACLCTNTMCIYIYISINILLICIQKHMWYNVCAFVCTQFGDSCFLPPGTNMRQLGSPEKKQAIKLLEPPIGRSRIPPVCHAFPQCQGCPQRETFG